MISSLKLLPYFVIYVNPFLLPQLLLLQFKITCSLKPLTSFWIQPNKHIPIKNQENKLHYHIGLLDQNKKMQSLMKIIKSSAEFLQLINALWFERLKKRKRNTHHEWIDKDVIVLERIESGCGSNPIFACFAKLQCSYYSWQCSKHQKVKSFHFIILFFSQIKEKWIWIIDGWTRKNYSERKRAKKK